MNMSAIRSRPNGSPQKERLYHGVFEIYREFKGTRSAVTLTRESLHVMDDKNRGIATLSSTSLSGIRNPMFGSSATPPR